MPSNYYIGKRPILPQIMTKLMIPLLLWVNLDLETDGSRSQTFNKRKLLGLIIEILYFMTSENGYEYRELIVRSGSRLDLSWGILWRLSGIWDC